MSKITDLLQAIDAAFGRVRALYYKPSVASFLVGRGKTGGDCLASNPVTQALQSQHYSSKLKTLCAGGGTKGSSKLWAFLVGQRSSLDDSAIRHKAWLASEFASGGAEGTRKRIMLDVLLSRLAPTAIQVASAEALRPMSKAELITECGKRVGKEAANEYAAIAIALQAFVDKATEASKETKAKPASQSVSLQSLQAAGKAETNKRKAKTRKPKATPPNVS